MIPNADYLRSLPLDERKQRISELSPAEAEQLMFDWKFWARPNQLLPPGDWHVALMLMGRGSGKTRAGSEAVRERIKYSSYCNIIGPTIGDTRDICVLGESGILAVCPPSERPNYVATRRCLEWPNGAKSLLFSADDPERLRGPQHAFMWVEELASWRHQREVWDMMMFGLRLGTNPQVLVTTTPRPTPLIKELVTSPHGVVLRGTSYENRVNLAPQFFEQITRKYVGTRLGRQELEAELLSDNPGALFRRDDIERSRVDSAPELLRIVVAVDPAVTSREDSDLTGIVVAGIDKSNPPHFYVLDDRSLIASPEKWAREVVKAYREFRADRVIAEVNQGGDLVQSTLRNFDPNISYKSTHATKGKALRAEPVAALVEQGRIHFVGTLAQLEDQACDWNPQANDKSPDRLDAFVYAITELSENGVGTLGVIDALKLIKEGKYDMNGRPTNPDPKAALPWWKQHIVSGLTGEVMKMPEAAPDPGPCPDCGSAFARWGQNLAMCNNCGLQLEYCEG